MTDSITSVPEAVSALGALPVPVGNQPQPLDDQRLAEIAARVEAATPGPWGSHRDLVPSYTVQARPRTTRYGMETDGDIATMAGRSDSEDYANARFIAHARADVPVLLAEVQRLKAELAEARERALHEAADWFDRAADAEPDQAYRARVMRGAANDIRRLVAAPNKAATT